MMRKKTTKLLTLILLINIVIPSGITLANETDSLGNILTKTGAGGNYLYYSTTTGSYGNYQAPVIPLVYLTI